MSIIRLNHLEKDKKANDLLVDFHFDPGTVNCQYSLVSGDPFPPATTIIGLPS